MARSPLTPQQAYAQEIRRIYAEAETRMILKVARRLSKGILEPDWEEIKLAEIRAVQKEITAEIGGLRKLSPHIEAAIGRAYDAGVESSAAALKRANLTQLATPEDLAVAKGAAVRAYAAQSVGALESTHLNIFRSTQDAYRSVIVEAGRLGITGTETRIGVAQQALNRWADKGITGFIDRAGRNWDLASYAETAVRSASQRATLTGRFDKLKAENEDLVIVSVSPEACPLCEPWEGQILSISGNSNEYPSVAEAEAGGLFHNGCTHDTPPYVEGLTDVQTEEELAAYHEKSSEDYKDRERQRELERGIRQWKNREAAATLSTEAGAPQEAAKASAKVSEWQGKMREFIDTTDRQRQPEREQVGKAR